MITSSKLSVFSDINHGFTTKKEKVITFLKNAISGQQTHSTSVSIITSAGNKYIPKVDGLITMKKNIVLSVRTADCVAMLLFDPKKKIIAALHAGWKGTKESILKMAIEKMKQLGSTPTNILLAIGPSIGLCCYDIPRNRAKVFPEESIAQKREKYFLDLKGENYRQAKELGILPSNIEVLNYCTYHQDDLFYSFRRDKNTKNTMYAYIRLNT